MPALQINMAAHKGISGNHWFTVRKLAFSVKDHGATPAFVRDYHCFVCTACHPFRDGSCKYTDSQMSAFVGMVDRPKALTGFFKLYRSQFNSSTLKAHSCLAIHSLLWNLLLRYLKFVGHGNDTKIVGRGRKRQGRDPNVQLLSACWDLKTHRKLQKQDPLQVKFIKDLVLLIAKALVPISLCENPWFQRAFLRHTPSLNFPTRKQLRQLYIPQLRCECYQRHVKKLLDQVVAGWGTIDLYMSLPSGDIMSQQFHAIVKTEDPSDDTGQVWALGGVQGTEKSENGV